MRAVDANVVIRLVTHDDEKQLAAAEAFVATGAWVSHVVLVEVVWVLESVYNRGPVELAAIIEVLLNHEHLTLQDSDIVSAALDQFRKRPAIDFSDCLVLEIARRAGKLPLGTFDRNLGKLDGVQRL